MLASAGVGAMPLVASLGVRRAAAQRSEITWTELDDAATGEHRMHLPRVNVPALPRTGRPFDLVVRVGEPMHEQRRDHFIQRVTVRHADELLFDTELGPSVPFPVVRVPVMLRRAGDLVVEVRCSQHGGFVWRTRLEPE